MSIRFPGIIVDSYLDQIDHTVTLVSSRLADSLEIRYNPLSFIPKDVLTIP